MKEAVLWDFDDVIVETRLGLYQHFCQFAKDNNLRVPTLQEMDEFWGRPAVKLRQALWPNLDNYPGYFLPQPFNGIDKVITKIHDGGFIQGIVSSGPRSAIVRVLEDGLASVAGIFCFIYADTDCVHYKPDPRVFDAPLSDLAKMGVSEQKIWYLGDHITDYWAASRRGLKFLGILTGSTTSEQFLMAGLKEENIVHHPVVVPERLMGQLNFC